jgi:hypothetical protein
MKRCGSCVERERASQSAHRGSSFGDLESPSATTGCSLAFSERSSVRPAAGCRMNRSTCRPILQEPLTEETRAASAIRRKLRCIRAAPRLHRHDPSFLGSVGVRREESCRISPARRLSPGFRHQRSHGRESSPTRRTLSARVPQALARRPSRLSRLCERASIRTVPTRLARESSRAADRGERGCAGAEAFPASVRQACVRRPGWPFAVTPSSGAAASYAAVCATLQRQ